MLTFSFNSLFTFCQVLKKELSCLGTFAQSLRKQVSIIILIVTNNIVPKNKKLFKCVGFFSLSSKSFLFLKDSL